MELKYIVVTKESITLLDSVRSVYMDSFPEEERRPWESIVALIESGAPFFKFIIVQNKDNEDVGFYTLWRFPEARYIEHFAVKPALRGNGIGTEIISKIIAEADNIPVVIEVEPADSSDQASARIRFYEKAGFTAMIDYEYIQPPYAKGLPEVPMMLMSTGLIPDLDMFVLQLHTLVYNK